MGVMFMVYVGFKENENKENKNAYWNKVKPSVNLADCQGAQ